MSNASPYRSAPPASAPRCPACGEELQDAEAVFTCTGVRTHEACVGTWLDREDEQRRAGGASIGALADLGTRWSQFYRDLEQAAGEHAETIEALARAASQPAEEG
jgi:hypothetical protein